MKKEGICRHCNKEKTIHTKDGLCNWCYRKIKWKPKLKECKRCKRMKSLHAKGFCPGCYNSTFHLDRVKEHNARRRHNIAPELYRKLTKLCMFCGFNKLVELHHLDHNRKNNSEDNLVGLCPNHHKMLHSKRYQKEIFDGLRQKGFKVPETGYATDGFTGIRRKSQNL